MAKLAEQLRAAAVRVLHEVMILRLRLDGWLAGFGRSGRQPRIMATACWTFPIYSQTFVHQEVLALARGGFGVRFLYAKAAPRQELGIACDSLWSLRRRVILHRATGANDLARFRRSHPDEVEALTFALVQASGISGEELMRNEHYLCAFSFARAVQAWKPDYLHSYFFYEQTLFAWVASRLLKIPRGVSCYADHMLQDYALKSVRLHLQECSVVVATSQRIAAELTAIHGAPLPSLLVKPNAIDTAAFRSERHKQRSSGEALRLLCVCRIDPKKGIEFLLAAVRTLLDQGLAVEAKIIGAPDTHSADAQAYARALDQMVAEENLQTAIQLVGQRGHLEIRRELLQADVFVAPFVDLPSGDKDGIPTAVLEAMAAGCAIVASDGGSIVEVIDDGVEGLLVAQRDSSALAAGISRLAGDPELRAQLGAKARERAQRDFDVESCEVPFHQRVRGAISGHRQMSANAVPQP